MSDQIIEELRWIGNLLSELPQAICDEMEKREELKKAQRLKELQSELEFLHEHNAQINKMMFSTGWNLNKEASEHIEMPTKIKIVPNDPKDNEVAEQLTKLVNYNLQNGIEDEGECHGK